MQVSGSQDKTVALWDLEAGKQVQAFVGHTHFVEGAWVPTHYLVASH
jgi:WD40 repeat protein